jgi:hypothetical protein
MSLITNFAATSACSASDLLAFRRQLDGHFRTDHQYQATIARLSDGIGVLQDLASGLDRGITERPVEAARRVNLGYRRMGDR